MPRQFDNVKPEVIQQGSSLEDYEHRLVFGRPKETPRSVLSLSGQDGRNLLELNSDDKILAYGVETDDDKTIADATRQFLREFNAKSRRREF